MGIKVSCITRNPVLCTDLCELAGPIRQHQGPAFVIQPRVKRPVGRVHAPAEKPSPGKLVVSRGVETKSTLESGQGVERTGDNRAGGERRLVLLPPDELAAQCKCFVIGLMIRLPP